MLLYETTTAYYTRMQKELTFGDFFFFLSPFLVCFADLNNSAGMLDLGRYLRWQQILGCLEEALITCFVL